MQKTWGSPSIHRETFSAYLQTQCDLWEEARSMQSPEEWSERQKEQDREGEEENNESGWVWEIQSSHWMCLHVCVCMVSLWCCVPRLGFLYGGSSLSSPPLCPPLSERLVWLRPPLSLAHSEEGLSSYCISFYQSAETEEPAQSSDHLDLPLFFYSPFFPHFWLCLSLSLLSLLSHQHPASKNKDRAVEKDNLLFFFFSWRWALKIHTYMCRGTRQH